MTWGLKLRPVNQVIRPEKIVIIGLINVLQRLYEQKYSLVYCILCLEPRKRQLLYCRVNGYIFYCIDPKDIVSLLLRKLYFCWNRGLFTLAHSLLENIVHISICDASSYYSIEKLGPHNYCRLSNL